MKMSVLPGADRRRDAADDDDDEEMLSIYLNSHALAAASEARAVGGAEARDVIRGHLRARS